MEEAAAAAAAGAAPAALSSSSSFGTSVTEINNYYEKKKKTAVVAFSQDDEDEDDKDDEDEASSSSNNNNNNTNENEVVLPEQNQSDQNNDPQQQHDPHDNQNRTRRRPPLERSTGGRGQRHFYVVPTNFDEYQTVSIRHGHESWQAQILTKIHSHWVQTLLMLLLLADVCILFIELFLAAEFPACYIIERDAISCCPAPASSSVENEDQQQHDGDHDNNRDLLSIQQQQQQQQHSFITTMQRFLATTGDDNDHHHYDDHDDHHELCNPPWTTESPEYEATCDSHKRPWLHTVHTTLFSLTMMILGIFFVELMVLLLALGPRTFFHHFFYVLDLFVVTSSMGLELVFFILEDDVLEALVGLLVIFRVWRFIRIGHGLVEVTVEATSQKQHQLVMERQFLEDLLKQHGIDIPEYNSDQHHDRVSSHHQLGPGFG